MATKPPLVVRWHALELAPVQAGAPQDATVEVANDGGARWRTRGHEDGLFLSYHWLDERGNPILWDGIRTPLERDIDPGERVTHPLRVRGPIPPGRYRLAVDLVEERRFWLADLGNAPLERDVDVSPRDSSAARAFFGDDVEPDEQWLDVVHTLHAEGYSAVGGALVVGGGRFRKADPALEPYAPGGGRNPVFRAPLVCPSLLPPLEPNAEVAGLPAWRPEPGNEEPWMFDGRAIVRLRSRSGRRRA
jgi:hypothetical protein